MREGLRERERERAGNRKERDREGEAWNKIRDRD